MTHLFYILVVLCIAIEIIVFAKQKGVHRALSEHQKKQKESGKVSFEDTEPKVVAYSIVMMMYWILCLIGLMSSQWLGFLIVILLGCIPKRKLWWRYADSALTILVLLFIILNKYHFNVDFINLLFK